MPSYVPGTGVTVRVYVINSASTVVGWNENISRWEPVPGLPTNITLTSCGYGRCVALTRNGELWAWGEFGTNTDYREAERVSANVSSVIAGCHREYGVNTDGTLYLSTDRGAYGGGQPSPLPGGLGAVTGGGFNDYCTLSASGRVRCGVSPEPAELAADFVSVVANLGAGAYLPSYYCGQRANGVIQCWLGGALLGTATGLPTGSRLVGLHNARGDVFAVSPAGALYSIAADGTTTHRVPELTGIVDAAGEGGGEFCILRSNGAVRCSFVGNAGRDMPNPG